MASLLRIAEVLQLPGYDNQDQQRVVKAVQHWFATHGQWLLICDNVEDLSLLDRFLPAHRPGAMLLTTCGQTLGTPAQGMNLLPMEPYEGIPLLLRRAKMLGAEAIAEQVQSFAQHMPQQYEAAATLIEARDGLPLALDQAGAYLEETRCGLLAGAPHMPYVEGYQSVLFNIAIERRVHKLPPEEARLLLTEPIRHYLEYDPLAVEKMLALTDGWPYFIPVMSEKLIQHCNTIAKSYVTVSEVNVALDMVLREQAAFVGYGRLSLPL